MLKFEVKERASYILRCLLLSRKMYLKFIEKALKCIDLT